MAQGGWLLLDLLGMGGGTIRPFNPFSGSPVRNRTVISGLDIRNESQRLRVDSPNNRTLKDLRGILSQALDAIQANADVQDGRFRELSGSVNSLGLSRDKAGNIIFTGATFTVNIATSKFQLALGNMTFPVASVAPDDSQIPNNGGCMYLDEVGNALKVRIRYSDGTLKTGTIALI